jgi:RNA polymerase sigma-70 factor (ECF subfamily)
MSPVDPPFRDFQTTHWSRVIAARAPGTPEAAEALAALCRDYWLPIYAFFRRHGAGVEEAEDLTQEFVAREFIENNLLQHVDRRSGVKFRHFLVRCLKNDFVDEIRKTRALKRGSGVRDISIDAIQAERWLAQPEMADPWAAEELVDYAIARTVLTTSLQRLETEQSTEKAMQRFKLLKPYLLSESADTGYAEVGRQLGISAGGVKSAVFRFRQRYLELLKEEVAAMVTDPADIREELRYLLKVYSRGIDAPALQEPPPPHR